MRWLGRLTAVVYRQAGGASHPEYSALHRLCPLAGCFGGGAPPRGASAGRAKVAGRAVAWLMQRMPLVILRRHATRAGRAPRELKETVTTVRSRIRRPGAVSVNRNLGQRRGVKKRVASWPCRQPRMHAARSACSVGGRLVLHVTKRDRAVRHGTRKRRLRRFEAVKADLVRCR